MWREAFLSLWCSGSSVCLLAVEVSGTRFCSFFSPGSGIWEISTEKLGFVSHNLSVKEIKKNIYYTHSTPMTVIKINADVLVTRWQVQFTWRFCHRYAHICSYTQKRKLKQKSLSMRYFYIHLTNFNLVRHYISLIFVTFE